MTDQTKDSPKHGSAEGSTSDQHPQQHKKNTPSVSQADGTAAEAPAGETQSNAQPSGYSGENPATAGNGSTKVESSTPENRKGEINPSTQTSATKDPTDRMPKNPTRDSAGEVGEPTGKGNMDVSEETFKKGTQLEAEQPAKAADGNRKEFVNKDEKVVSETTEADDNKEENAA